jgi:hypothetical protein
MAPRIGHRELLSIHQDKLEHHQANLNELTTNALRNPLREHLDISGFDIKNARRIQTSNSLQVGTSVTVGNSITINQNIALGGNITDLDGNVLTFGDGSGGTIYTQGTGITISPSNVISIDQAASLNLTNLSSTTRGSTDNSTNVATTAFVKTAISTFTAHPTFGITANDITNWNTAYDWGDHSIQGYLTSTDILNTHPTFGITANDITNWNTAYDWGDHSIQGYLTSTDILNTHPTFGITANDITNWNTAYDWGDHSIQGYLTSTDILNTLVDGDFTTAGIMATDGSGNYRIITDNSANWNTAYDWGDHSIQGYLTSTDILNTHPTFGITANDITNWNTAYDWGDHSIQGYLTSTDILNTHPTFGITANDITNWNTAYDWGDHSIRGYLTSTDILNTLVDGDFTTAGIMATDGSGNYRIITDNSANWNTAYDWGDHSIQGYLTSTDILNTHPTFGITANDITNWNTAYDWGDHSIQGYLTSTDILNTHPTFGITANDITNWHTAYDWGDHSIQGYLTSTDILNTLVDGDFTTAGIMATDGSGNYRIITDNSANWNTAYDWGDHSIQGYLTSTDILNTHPTFGITANDITNWNTAYDWGDHSIQGYLTSTDILNTLVDGDFTTAGIMATDGSGNYRIITDNSANWNTAHDWGDHSIQGYLTGMSSINDLSDVNTSGASSGEVLSWDGSNWTPTNITSAVGINGYVSYFTSSNITSDYTAGLTGLIQLTSLASFGNTVTYNTNYFTFSENGKYKISISGLFRTTNSSTEEANAPTIYLSYSIDNGTSWTSLANVLYLKNVAETNSIQKPFNTLSNDGIIEVADYTTFRIRVISDKFSSGAKCSHFRIDFMNITDSSSSSITVETDPIFTAHPTFGITANDITNWNTAHDWGDHSIQGYLTGMSSINDLADVNTSGASSGEVLSWDGSNWTPTNITSAAGINGYVSYFTSSNITSDYTAGLTGLIQLTSLASFGNTVTYNTNYFTFSENGKYKISIYGLFRTTDSSTEEANAPSIYLSYSIDNGTSWTSLANVLYLKNVAETNSIQKPLNSLSSDGIIEVADYSTFRIRVNSSNFGTGAKCSYFRIDFMNINPIFDANPSLTWTRTGSDVYFTGGNVGINQGTPLYKLDVEGDVRINNGFINHHFGSSHWVLTHANHISNASTHFGMFLHDNNGETVINAPTNSYVALSVANNYQVRVHNDHIRLGDRDFGYLNNVAVSVDARDVGRSSAVGYCTQNDSNWILVFYNASRNGSKGKIRGNGSSNGVIYDTSSDRRLKENITPMPNMLEKIKQLEPVYYTWKSDGNKGDGFIAQDVHKIFPQMRDYNCWDKCKCGMTFNDAWDGKTCMCEGCDVENPKQSTNGIDYIFGLDYGKFTPYIIKAMQEQQEIIESQDTKINQLHQENTLLKNKLNEVLQHLNLEQLN